MAGWYGPQHGRLKTSEREFFLYNNQAAYGRCFSTSAVDWTRQQPLCSFFRFKKKKNWLEHKLKIVFRLITSDGCPRENVFLVFSLERFLRKSKMMRKKLKEKKECFQDGHKPAVCVCLRSGIGMIVAMSWSAGVFWFARLPDWGYFELIYVTVGIRIGGLFCQSPKVRRTERAQQGVDTTRTVGERREPAGRADNLSASTVLSTGHFYQ